MSENVCPQCGAPINPDASECKFCGEKLVQKAVNQTMNQNPMAGQPQVQNVYIQQPQQPVMQPMYTGINPSWPIKNKIVAGILAILLGGIGIHKFYLGKIGMGILYVCFCWTGIPAIIGFIEGLLYLCSNDENFQLKNHVRIG